MKISFVISVAAVGSMIAGLCTVNNAISGDQIDWILLLFAALIILFSLKNFIWLFRKRVVVRDSEITIHLPFVFFNPIRFDKRYILGYGELTETDDKVGTYQYLRVLNESGKVHEIQSFTVPEYDEIISFLKKHDIKNLGITLFEDELNRRQRAVGIAKRIDTFFTIGALVLFLVIMFFFVYYTFL